ncbi:MAG: hypothetical protein ACWA5R_09430 [bacterium]
MSKEGFGPQFGNDSQVKTNSMAVRRNCGVADYAMAHELAHIMGGCHDRSTQAAQTCYLDSRAHFENGIKRSLLAAKTFYIDEELQDNCPNGCPLQPIYSNDDPGEFGLPNDGLRDYRTANTQVLREAAAFVGGFRPMTDMQLSQVAIASSLPGRTTAHKFLVEKIESNNNKASDVRLTIAFGPNAPSFFVNFEKIIPAGTTCSQVTVGNDNQFSFDKVPTEGGGYYHYQCDFGTIEDNALRSVEFYLNTLTKMASFDLHIDAFLDLNTTETSYSNNDKAITHSGF